MEDISITAPTGFTCSNIKGTASNVTPALPPTCLKKAHVQTPVASTGESADGKERGGEGADKGDADGKERDDVKTDGEERHDEERDDIKTDEEERDDEERDDAALATASANLLRARSAVMNATDLRMPTLIDFNLKKPITDAQGTVLFPLYQPTPLSNQPQGTVLFPLYQPTPSNQPQGTVLFPLYQPTPPNNQPQGTVLGVDHTTSLSRMLLEPTIVVGG
jgi:hypothetical protein